MIELRLVQEVCLRALLFGKWIGLGNSFMSRQRVHFFGKRKEFQELLLWIRQQKN